MKITLILRNPSVLIESFLLLFFFAKVLVFDKPKTNANTML